mmetsp:Transcript_23580/g.74029  ORF Transcript_23580/g.74029 Transcript_23580/m.74029 type:complete len:257 (-) Transcript_23580:4346-5116(-)
MHVSHRVRRAAVLARRQPRTVVVHEVGALSEAAVAVGAIYEPVLGTPARIAEHLHEQDGEVQLVRVQFLGSAGHVLGRGPVAGRLVVHAPEHLEVVRRAEPRAHAELQEQVPEHREVRRHRVQIRLLRRVHLVRRGFRAGVPGEGHLVHRNEMVPDPHPGTTFKVVPDQHLELLSIGELAGRGRAMRRRAQRSVQHLIEAGNDAGDVLVQGAQVRLVAKLLSSHDGVLLGQLRQLQRNNTGRNGRQQPEVLLQWPR